MKRRSIWLLGLLLAGGMVGIFLAQRLPSFGSRASPLASVATPIPIREKSAEPAANPEATIEKLVPPAPSPQPSIAQARAALDVLLRSLPGLPENERGAVVSEFLDRMRSFKAGGLQVLAEFLRRGEDVRLQSHFQLGDGRLSEIPTLRTAILEMLNDSADPAVVEISLATLRSTSSLLEGALAIRNLEKRSPGSYRTEALGAVRELVANLAEELKLPIDPANDGPVWERTVMTLDLMRLLKSPDLVVAGEAAVLAQPFRLTEYVCAIQSMSREDQMPALQHLFTDPQLAALAASQPHGLRMIDLREPASQELMFNFFARGMSVREREEYLSDFAMEVVGAFPGLVTNRAEAFQAAIMASAEEKRHRAQSKLNFLSRLTPYASTPVLQQRVAEARTALQDALKTN